MNRREAESFLPGVVHARPRSWQRRVGRTARSWKANADSETRADDPEEG